MMDLARFTNQRGNVLLLTTVVVLPLMVIFAGLATDLAYLGLVDAELQRSVDAAALAGAGNLGFDGTVFLKVRQEARKYAGLDTNRYRVGQVDLQLNTGNDLGGDIVLGVYANGTFRKSDVGTEVNAVLCRYATTVPTSFLRLLGFNSLPAAAQAIAIANPPVISGCGEPILPLGVTQCSFQDPGGAFNNSSGCGTAITFIRSQTLCRQGVSGENTSQLCNTGTWVSLNGENPTPKYLENAIQSASNPNACNVTLGSGSTTTANGGMLDPAYQALADEFVKRYAPLLEPITKADGTTVKGINGQDLMMGWKAGVMVLATPSCPPGQIAGEQKVATYAPFVVTQVFNQKEGCVVQNLDPQAQSYCYDATGKPRKDNDLRAVFGYFKCGQLGQVATIDPVPRAALAERLRLVR
jgi:hypothetical protein